MHGRLSPAAIVALVSRSGENTVLVFSDYCPSNKYPLDRLG